MQKFRDYAVKIITEFTHKKILVEFYFVFLFECAPELLVSRGLSYMYMVMK